LAYNNDEHNWRFERTLTNGEGCTASNVVYFQWRNLGFVDRNSEVRLHCPVSCMTWESRQRKKIAVGSLSKAFQTHFLVVRHENSFDDAVLRPVAFTSALSHLP